ncbi:GNAT family N-acetyltransferase [Acidaminobacterium chupaoyuni]
MTAVFRRITIDELKEDFLKEFDRTQVVRQCLRRENGVWKLCDVSFTDGWEEGDKQRVIRQLRETLKNHGVVWAAFWEGHVKGLASVEGEAFGSRKQYLQLSHLHVSRELRGKGIGSRLFELARCECRHRQIPLLYISAHSARESQLFYEAKGCVDAEEPQAALVEKEPCDRQMQCPTFDEPAK